MSDTTAAIPPLDPFTVVRGGHTIDVQTFDDTTESVKVRLLPVNAYPDFAALLGDEVGQVALFCNKPREWAANLHPQSHDDVMTAGHALNLSFFERWVSRQQKARQATDPALNARLEKIAAEVLREELVKRLPASLSLNSSPASLESPAAVS